MWGGNRKKIAFLRYAKGKWVFKDVELSDSVNLKDTYLFENKAFSDGGLCARW